MMQMERKSDIVRLPFGGMNHYDNNGHKVGESRPGFFGGLNHYDDKGHKRGIAIQDF